MIETVAILRVLLHCDDRVPSKAPSVLQSDPVRMISIRQSHFRWWWFTSNSLVSWQCVTTDRY